MPRSPRSSTPDPEKPAATRKAAAPRKPAGAAARKKRLEPSPAATVVTSGTPFEPPELALSGTRARATAEPSSGRGTKAQPAARAAATYDPSLDEIAERAYQIYQRRGGIHGNDMDDWLEAERQLREEHKPGE
jgi:hypothetical protein